MYNLEIPSSETQIFNLKILRSLSMRFVEKRVLRSKIYPIILLVSRILKSTFIFFKRHVRFLGAEVRQF